MVGGPEGAQMKLSGGSSERRSLLELFVSYHRPAGWLKSLSDQWKDA